MFNPWLAMWALFFIGLFIVGVTAYDCLDRKSRGQRINKGACTVALLVGIALMAPVLFPLLFYLLPLYFRSM